jgi:hypothetical protein
LQPQPPPWDRLVRRGSVAGGVAGAGAVMADWSGKVRYGLSGLVIIRL